MKLVVTPEAKELGIKVCMAVIRHASISNRSGPLEKLKKEVIEKIQVLDNQIIKFYRDIENFTIKLE